jgi:hypothetical protein
MLVVRSSGGKDRLEIYYWYSLAMSYSKELVKYGVMIGVHLWRSGVQV